MAVILPNLRGATPELYPFTRSIRCNTQVTRWQDGSEQRCVRSLPILRFDLPFSRLNATDKSSVMAAVASAVGQSSTMVSLQMGNVNYTNMSFDSDFYSGTNRIAAMWDSGLKLTQTIAQNLQPTTTLAANILATDTSIPVASVAGFNGFIRIGSETIFIPFGSTNTGTNTFTSVLRGALGTTAASHSSGDTVSWGCGYSSGQAFPALANGTRTQTNWQQNQQWKSDAVILPAGPKWTYPWYGGHLIDFPTEGLRQWLVGGDMLTDQDVAQMEAHFLANLGRFASFTMTDPETGTTYPTSYYSSDEFQVQHLAPNLNRCYVPVEAYNQGSGITGATLSFTTSHILGTGQTASANVSLGSGAVIFDGSAYSDRTDSTSWNPGTGAWGQALGPITVTANPTTISVAFFLFQSIGGSASPPEKMYVYECSLAVTYADGSSATLHPTIATVVPDGSGTVLNPANAIDRNPSTFAEIDRSTFGGSGRGPQLVLSTFR